MALLYINKVKTNREEFGEKVIRISRLLGVDPNWLMHVMNFETAGTMNHAIQNETTNATGLIQFMPDTAYSLGTSVEALKSMSNVEQLDYVYKHLRPYKSKIKSFVDLYFTVFFPLAIGKPADWVFETRRLHRSKIAAQNKIFDLDKNGFLTIGEVETAMLKSVPAAFIESFKKKRT